MKYRLLGKQTGLFVSEMALGTANFGTANGYGADAVAAREIFDAYTDLGGNFIDTADFYQLGEAETLLGDLITGRRSNYVIATKYSRGNPQQLAAANIGNHRKAMREAVDASLRRLKTDYIDIYLAHFDDKHTPIAEMARGLEDLVSSGKVLYTGLSNFAPWRCAAIPGITAVQVEYNLLQRDVEQDYFPMAEEMGMAVMGYSPLAGGLLTGKYRKGEQGRMTLLKSGAIGSENKVLDVLDSIGAETGATPGQIAMAWTRHMGIFPIIGARTIAQCKESLTPIQLSAEHLQQLDTATRPVLRYPANIDIIGMMTHTK